MYFPHIESILYNEYEQKDILTQFLQFKTPEEIQMLSTTKKKKRRNRKKK